MTRSLPCHDAVRRLWSYLDGELEVHDHELIDDHLRFCLRCCGELEFARELRGLLRDHHVTAPTTTRQRLEAFIDELDAPPHAPDPSPTTEHDQELHRDP